MSAKNFGLSVFHLQTMCLFFMPFKPLHACQVLMFLSRRLLTKGFQLAAGLQPFFLQFRKSPSTSRNHPDLLRGLKRLSSEFLPQHVERHPSFEARQVTG